MFLLVGKPIPDAAAAGRKALLASRQNMVFSVSMLFYMVGTSHFYAIAFPDATSSNANVFLLISLVIIALLECNAVACSVASRLAIKCSGHMRAIRMQLFRQ